jgi:parvulin-like peptidyl-prolyl isomerase
MKTTLVALAAVALAAPAAASARPAQEVPPGAIAVVAGEAIARAEFDALVARARRSYTRAGRPFPGPGTSEYRRLQDQAVRILVQRVQYRQKAAQLGIVVTQAHVEARIADVKRHYGSERRFRQALARAGLTLADLRRDIHAQLVAEAIYEAVTAAAVVTEEEIAAYYEGHTAEFTRPQSRDVAHIMVRTRSRAIWIYRQVKAGASFAALARRYSLDQGSRARGGRLTVARGQTVAPFDRVAFSLRTGRVSRPVRTQFGWHVIKALSRIRPAERLPFARVRDRIARDLLQRKKQDLMSAWVTALEQEYAGKIVYAPGFAPGR